MTLPSTSRDVLLAEEAPPVDSRKATIASKLLPRLKDQLADLADELRLDLEGDLHAGVVVSPGSVTVRLRGLPTWPRLRALPMKDLAAVLFSVCRRLCAEGYRRAYYEAPRNGGGESINPQVLTAVGLHVDGWDFLMMPSELQVQAIPDRTNRERIIGNLRRDAVAPPEDDANGWKIIVEIL